MKQVAFEELVNKTILALDNTAINRVILIVTDDYLGRYYYWLDADVTVYGISYPVLYELTEEEAEKYLESSVADLN